MTSETKQCQNCKQNFVIEPEDFEFYEKMDAPAPKICPECRYKRLCQVRNETALYNRKCDFCNKPIVSVYNPKSPYTVYCHTCWDSDKWDPKSYAQDYDEKRPFFEQYNELMKKVPKVTTSLGKAIGESINSEYTNVAGANKDCYLIFNSAKCENSMYSRGLVSCNDAVDTYFGLNSEQCYEAINYEQSSGIIFGQNVNGCLNSHFLFDVSGCHDCFGVVNGRHRKYQFFDEVLSKGEYEKRVNEIRGSYSKMEEAKEKFYEYSLRFPRKENNNLKALDCIGDYIFESKNIKYGFEVMESENCKYMYSIKFAKDSYDCLGYGYGGELMLGCVAVGYSNNVVGSFIVENSHNIEYGFSIRGGSHDCLGCDGLKGAEYCILNKQYIPEEYHRLRKKIIAELKEKELYGLFMPPEILPFAYNETVAQDNIPLSKEEALAQGFRWEDDVQVTEGRETLRPEDIPDHINDVQDSITNEVLACINCRRNYRIIQAELEFYRKMILPIPRRCFYCRHKERIRRRGQFKIYDRKCAKCSKEIKTSYAPERPEIVYCEECYQREVV